MKYAICTSFENDPHVYTFCITHSRQLADAWKRASKAPRYNYILVIDTDNESEYAGLPVVSDMGAINAIDHSDKTKLLRE